MPTDNYGQWLEDVGLTNARTIDFCMKCLCNAYYRSNVASLRLLILTWSGCFTSQCVQFRYWNLTEGGNAMYSTGLFSTA